jgi:hypothetical protein
MDYRIWGEKMNENSSRIKGIWQTKHEFDEDIQNFISTF